MNDVFSYTGKPFPQKNYFYELSDGKPKLKGFLQYLETHGAVIGGNWRREFAKDVERKHGEPLSKNYENMIVFLENNGFIVEGEPRYRIRRNGIRTIRSARNGSSSCAYELLCILKNLYAKHTDKEIKPFEYFKPVEHFKLLTEVESDNNDFIGKADAFNSYMKMLSKMNLVEIILPSNHHKLWIEWFTNYAKNGK